MEGGLLPHGGGQYPQTAEIGPLSLTDRLTNEKKRLVLRLAKVDQVLEYLENNKDTQRILDLISEIGGF